MKVKFWGTRGSLPVALTSADIRQKLIRAFEGAAGKALNTKADIEAYVNSLNFDIAGTFGGHSSCVQIDIGSNEGIFCDFGSGARPLAGDFIRKMGKTGQTYHVFISHVHWDHIMGFPFFTPVYVPGNRIIIHGCHQELEQAFRLQQGAPCFPVDYSQLGATIEYDYLEPDKTYEIAGMKVTTKKQLHGGDSYGYRFEHAGKSVVYSTDSEHKLDDIAAFESFAAFFKEADLVIFDGMYSLADAISVNADWGHSSNLVGLELCQIAQAKRLALFHHEPSHNDTKIADVLNETRKLEELTRQEIPLEVISAYDGLEIRL
jgi:phosphoribosyl 1,2-cyclic phosphodiesterase